MFKRLETDVDQGINVNHYNVNCVKNVVYGKYFVALIL